MNVCKTRARRCDNLALIGYLVKYPHRNLPDELRFKGGFLAVLGGLSVQP
jgi:hypothetical protein